MSSLERFMVVAFTEPQEVHWLSRRSFTVWPQHMTVAPWMHGHRPQAAVRIADAVQDQPPQRAIIDGTSQFGPDGKTAVWTLGPAEPLKRLHTIVLQAALQHGTVLEDDTYTGERYRPHITQKAGQPVHALHETLLLPELSIIGVHEVLGKIVLHNIPLEGHEAAA